MTKTLFGILAAISITACSGGGGPSDSELKRACIDSGAFRGDEDKPAVCSCMTKEIRSNKIDRQYMLEHWQAQKAKGYTGSFLPASVDASIARRCGRNIR